MPAETAAKIYETCSGRPLSHYAAAMAICCHLFVTGYEERALRRRFNGSYLEYRQAVPRWIPRRPRLSAEAGR
jgi:protein-S-isoprenylcysteine O-methyltransferase Ste14